MANASANIEPGYRGHVHSPAMESERSARPNVVLTGFMGTGKTTVGRLVAALLDYEFVDTDELIESRHGTIAEIFETAGQAEFRRLEADAATALAHVEGTVIATGGRMMLDPENAEHLSHDAFVFCLVATPDEILDRVGDSDRPLLQADNPADRIEELLAERQAGYDEFHPIETSDRTPLEIAAEIVRYVTD